MVALPVPGGRGNSSIKRYIVFAFATVAFLFLVTQPSTSSRHRLSSAQFASVEEAEASDPSHNTTNFDHQLSAHVPKTSLAHSQCDAVSSWTIQDLAEIVAVSPTADPLLFHFHNGVMVSEDYNSFPVRAQFCTVFLAPQNPRVNESQYQNLPIEGWGPDSIHAELLSEDVRLVYELPDYWGALSARPTDATQANVVAVYMASFQLNQPGHYQTDGEVEFQNYDWVMEDPINLAEEWLPYDMTNNTFVPHSPAIEIYGIPISRPAAKCQHDGYNDLRGRWYRAAAFDRSGNQTLLNEDAFLEFTIHNTTVDEWGWTFAPDACELTYFSPDEHIACLNSRTIQVMGDSNSRRVLKSIMGGGIAWCQDPTERICQCEDHFQTEFPDVYFNEINASRFRDVFLRETPTPFGLNSNLYFDFVGGVLNPKLFNHWSSFFDSEPDRPSVIAQRLANNGPIDVVHISLIGWDMAAIRTPREMIAALPNFREKLYAAYPSGTRFVHRLANSMCCGNQNHKTRYSAPRFKMWNAMYRAFWAEDEINGIIQFDDPSVLQGRRDAETAFFCPTTHLRTSHVRLEQMIWMSATCEKNALGMVSMRDWGLE